MPLISGPRGSRRPGGGQPHWPGCSPYSCWPATARFLTTRRQVEVDFRDGLGVAPATPSGSPASTPDASSTSRSPRSMAASRPASIAATPAASPPKLKARTSGVVQASLTGQSQFNIVLGRPIQSRADRRAGRPGRGVQPFDPILEQVGLGPVERSNISHTIGRVRDVVVRPAAAASRRPRQRPRRDENPEGHDEPSPSVEGTCRATSPSSAASARRARRRGVARWAPGLVGQVERDSPRPRRHRGMASRSTTSTPPRSATSSSKVARWSKKMLVASTRRAASTASSTRATRSPSRPWQLHHPQQGRPPADGLQRLRDATGLGDKLVQKIFANPFVLSPATATDPRGRPGPECLRPAQVASSKGPRRRATPWRPSKPSIAAGDRREPRPGSWRSSGRSPR